MGGSIKDRLLITTMLKVIYWDGEHGHVLHEGNLGEGTAHYDGLTWDDQRIVYVSGADNYRYVIYRFQWPDFSPLPHIEGELHEVHQLSWHKGKLYACNTGKNRVEVWNGEQWAYKAWVPSPHDINHINALFTGGGLVYVAEHGRKTEKGSVVRLCTLDLEQLWLMNIGPDIHDVYAELGRVYNLTSPSERFGPAGILCTDIVGRIGTQKTAFPEWGMCLLRGLARTDDHWYIGMSRWEEKRDKRMLGDAIVVQLDNDFKEIARIRFPDFGPVCSVRVVGVRDYAHSEIVL